MKSEEQEPPCQTPPPEPEGPGRRVLAFLFCFAWLTPLFLCVEFWLAFPWLFLLLLPAVWFASGLRRKAWLRFVIATGTLLGSLFGRAMEGGEGAVWGALIGLVGGFVVAWYSLWLLRRIPDRWGSLVGWFLLGVAFTLLPLLFAIRMSAGRFDDDDSPFVILAIAYGLFHARGKGWWRFPFVAEQVRPVVVSWLRFWTGRRVLPWVVAFLAAGIVAGPVGSHFTTIADVERLSIVLDRISYIWPGFFVLAAAASWVCSRKDPPNPLHRVLCAIVFWAGLAVIVAHLRYHAEITPEHLHLRHGLWRSLSVSREDAATLETGTYRGRRTSGTFPILVTRSGKRHSLRSPYDHVLRDHLVEHWGLAVLPDSR